VFTQAEEEAFAHWLSEMALRGMGLRPCEFLDFIEGLVKKEHRKTPFNDGRPGFGWYTAFMSRNKSIVSLKPETQLELCRSKVTKDITDKWYSSFRDFLICKNIIDKPSRIWNADETGFNMGSNKSKVIEPARVARVPHVTAGKQRLTVMYCGSASGQMMPPFLCTHSLHLELITPLLVLHTQRKDGWMLKPSQNSLNILTSLLDQSAL
jgi:hypothetical protein